MVVKTMGIKSSPDPDLGKTQAPLLQARHLPGYIYTDPEVLRLEKERLFMRDWLCVGRVEEVENPGDYITFDILGEPIIVARSRAGTLHAFANVCAHRGVAVTTGHGNSKRFSCPYHGWVYDLEGRLESALHMDASEGFAVEQCRLQPYGLAQWQGWLFVNFDQNARDLESFLGTSLERFAFLHAEDCRLANKWEFEVECNWKTVVENFQDIYHLHTLHADTFGGAVDMEDHRPELLENGKFYNRPKAAGVMTPDGESRFSALPCWDGKEPLNSVCLGHINPNIMLFVRWDSIFMWNAWPISVDKTKVIFYTTFHKDHFRDPDFEDKVKVYTDFEKVVADEDTEMIRSLQRGFMSQAYKPGRMSMYEKTIHHMINHHLDTVIGTS